MADEVVVKKEVSARKIMAIMFSTTYCLIIILCAIGMINKIVTVETGVALIAAFALVVREIVSDYFQKNRVSGTSTEEKKI